MLSDTRKSSGKPVSTHHGAGSGGTGARTKRGKALLELHHVRFMVMAAVVVYFIWRFRPSELYFVLP
jgi:hypothetical protein